MCNEDVPRGGSVVGRRYTLRDRTECYEKIRRDYFAANSRYSPNTFRHHFRMRKELFLHIYDKVKEADPFFSDRPDATGRPGISSLQKILCSLRMLATGLSGDNLDEYFQIADSTATSCLKKFCHVVYEEFLEEFLHIPNEDDMKRILAQNAARGFLRMLGSIDCMHWGWKNCPTAWACQFRGHVKNPITILEVVADQDLWIWHVFFGMSGSHNDLNVLQRSNVFELLEEGTATKCEYTVNDHNYTQGYYLADGIYPNWAVFVQAKKSPRGATRIFTQRQEAVRKDVERAFGVLQARFHIVKNAARYHQRDNLCDIMMACVILHNMIIDDKRESNSPRWRPQSSKQPLQTDRLPTEEIWDEWKCILNRENIESRATNVQLTNDLIEHVYHFYANSLVDEPCEEPDPPSSLE